jgi:hypothetical protein
MSEYKCWDVGGKYILQKPWECWEKLLRMFEKSQERFQPILSTKNPKFLVISFVAELFKVFGILFFGNISAFLFFG